MTLLRTARSTALAAAFAASALGSAQAVVALPRLAIDTSKTTVSGLSSGGFMANQLGYSYAATFKGIGVFAAGPYMCAGHGNYTACMYNATISASMLNTMQADLNAWSGTSNDDKAAVAGQKVYLFVGTSDTTVGPNPMNAARTQYLNNGVAAANLVDIRRSGTAHVFPTDFDSTGNNGCGTSASPYISNCGYDGAEAMFTHFYGALIARNNAPAAANHVEFDQRRRRGLQRLPRRRQGQRVAGRRHELHRHGPERGDDLQLDRGRGRRERRAGRAVGRRDRDDHGHRAARRDVHDREQLRAHPGRPGAAERRLRARQRLEPEHRALERLFDDDAQADGHELLRDRDLSLTGGRRVHARDA